MGTWSSISTSEMPEDYIDLFTEFLGDNLSGRRWMFMAVDKTSCYAATITDFASGLCQIANRMQPFDNWRAKIWVSLLCSEGDGPVVVEIGPKMVEVLFASESDRDIIESARFVIDGHPEQLAFAEQQRRSAAEREAGEAKRERLRAKGQLYRPSN